MSKADVLIRRFEENDLPAVLELCDEIREHHRQILGGYFRELDRDFEQEAFLESLEDDRILALVAVTADNQLAGLLLAEKKFQPYLENPDIIQIGCVGVFKAFQKKGIGKALMDALYKHCQNNGIKEIKLGVFNKNVTAYQFYQDFGFEPLEQKMHLFVK